MKISYRDEAYKPMPIGYRFELVDKAFNVPLDLKVIDLPNVEIDGSGVLFPIKMDKISKEFFEAVDNLSYKMAECCEFVWHDSDRTVLKLRVSLDDAEFKPCLQIQIAPSKWTMDDIESLSPYLNEDIVYASMEFYAGNCTDETIEFFDLEFELEELKRFMWLLVQHIDMQNTGGKWIE